MVKIEINGMPLEVREGATVIEAADDAGITIPRFCYHKKLSIAASCRMCLVEVEKVAKPLPACATPVTEGMKVFTRSPKALAAQQAVMEFLLINHPLDCPICDQGGECDLQELAVGFGNDVSRYREGKRVVADKPIGPLIATDMTRCIHCTRCVRFGQEIGGRMELGAPGRGEHMRITTYLEDTVDSELSGNVIDLCPVGALTSRPFRFTARAWELQAHDGISPHDCVGANLRVETRGAKVMRVLPRENDAVNEVWLADRDRFSYTGLLHEERLLTPRIKRDGQWVDSDWDTALTLAAERLKGVVESAGAEQVGALASGAATVEELYLLQRVLRGMGSGNIDFRLRQQDFRHDDGAPATLGLALTELEQARAILVIGANVHKDQPLIGHRLRKAALEGAAVMTVNPVQDECRLPMAERIMAGPHRMVAELAAIAAAVADRLGVAHPPGLKGAPVGDAHQAIAKRLVEAAEQGVLLLGNRAESHPQRAELVALAGFIAESTGLRLGTLTAAGNGVGAALAGALPQREAGGRVATTAGKNWREMIASPLQAYLLMGIEPEYDCIDAAGMTEALIQAGNVIALTPFVTDAMKQYADILLPTALFPETSGTRVNIEGQWQSFAGATVPPGAARPAWKVLRVLGNVLGLDGFDYIASDEVAAEVKTVCRSAEAPPVPRWLAPEAVEVPDGLIRIVEYPIYASDGLVRRAAPLQATADARVAGAAVISPRTAAELGLRSDQPVRVNQGSDVGAFTLRISDKVPEGCVLVAAGQSGGLNGGLGYPVVTLAGQ